MPGNSTGCGPYAARHGPGSAPRRDRPPWTNFKEVAWLVVLHPILLFIGPQDVPSTMRHLACRGHIRQEDETGSLVPLAGDDLIPFVEAGLQPIAHRLDGAWFVTARTARAILRAFCHLDLYLVIRAGKC